MTAEQLVQELQTNMEEQLDSTFSRPIWATRTLLQGTRILPRITEVGDAQWTEIISRHLICLLLSSYLNSVGLRIQYTHF